MRARVPEVGDAVPRRFAPFTRALGALVLGAARWSFDSQPPNLPRMVVIVAPHTSNWDFPIAVAAMIALGLRVRWLGKHTIFIPPFGALLRWLGGIPVRRGERLGAVDEAVDAFASNRQMLLGLAPEGTRRRVSAWKTGYYLIAERAGVPVVPVWLDWSRRAIGFGAPVVAAGGAESLTAQIRERYYRPDMALRREGY